MDINKYIQQLYKCERLKESEIKLLCDKAKEILIQEPNIVNLQAPITVLHAHAPPHFLLRPAPGL